MPETILTVEDVAKSYGAHTLFTGVRFQVLERERVGLVGPNGAGKSTLLRIIAGEETPDDGRIVLQRGLRLGYVPQEGSVPPGCTVLEAALEACAPVRALEGQLLALAEQLAAARNPEEQAQLLAAYERVSLRFEAAGGYDLEVRARQVLAGIGFGEEQLARPVEQLSGGQRTRLALARALLADPDLLLLDEPTNHLDLAALDWLETFLQRWRGAVLVVSHDRYFLDQVTSRTLELAFGRLEEYPGNYSRYLELRAERFAERLAAYEAQQAYIRKEEAFIQRYRAGQRAREARGRATKLARLERLERPREAERLQLTLRASRSSSRTVLTTTPLTIGYPGRPLFRTPELAVQRGDRIAIVGPNGVGKSTLLRTLVGELPPLEGSLRYGNNVKPAYLEQEPRLDEERTVLETLMRRHLFSEAEARRFAAHFLFEGDDVFKPVGALSGGERRRLALALLTLERADLLLLDEPTNHLDLPSREALETVLDDFAGTIVFVSHDRYFIDRLATAVWAIEDGRLAVSLGNYSDYQRATQRQSSLLPEERPAHQRQTVPAPSRRTRSPRQIERELAQAERAIEELEARLRQLADDLDEATARQDVEAVAELGATYERLQAEIDQAYAHWERLQDELAALQVGGEL
ncbi:ABC-F family ATP-binding cassette domain-containing protein [Thermomicrobium sp. 4228-Ro]|uniref:ABC-F family ATP-binding cassette domain-containing protein n=1 Tax=Thermomicrobium sp. 4228-Ro TaxID=2993937 RepID=UPI00224944C1|nr:ABC-F family ATP-binding cassette domain-containing protein [Thermomicrobium sp. 4228-Ro]MCX2726848.1 ABC-F family ATP-binding cassette domain-containing protein [Thermomicrobium sp. 4228-Ro]